MTLLELNEYRERNEKLLRSQELLERLRYKAVPGSPSTEGMPHASGVSDKVGSLAIEITELEARIRYMEENACVEDAIVERYIDSIEDAETRLVFRLRFMRCFSWAEVAAVIGGGNTEDNMKKICYRHLHLDNDGWRTNY